MTENIANYLKEKYYPVLEHFLKMSEFDSEDDKTKSIYKLKAEVYSDFDVVKMKILSRRILNEEIPCIEEMNRMIQVLEKFGKTNKLNFAAKMLLNRLSKVRKEFEFGFIKKDGLLNLLKEESRSLFDPKKWDYGSYKWREYKKLANKEKNYNRKLEHELIIASSAEELIIKRGKIIPGNRITSLFQRKTKSAVVYAAALLTAFIFMIGTNATIAKQKLEDGMKNHADSTFVLQDTTRHGYVPSELAPILKDISLYRELSGKGLPLKFVRDDKLLNEYGAYAMFQGDLLREGGTVYYSLLNYNPNIPAGGVDTLKSSLFHELVHAQQDVQLTEYFEGRPESIPKWKIEFYYAKNQSTSNKQAGIHLGAELEAYYYEVLFENQKYGTYDKGTYAGFLSYYMKLRNSEVYSIYEEVKNITEKYYEDLVKVTGQDLNSFVKSLNSK